MQEEVTRGAVTLIVDGAKLSEQVFEKAVKKFLEEIQRSQKPKIYRGRQSLKQLASQNAGLANIEISDKNIKAFSHVAKKYHVDFALKKDTAAEQPRYLVFFKSRDADAITAASKSSSVHFRIICFVFSIGSGTSSAAKYSFFTTSTVASWLSLPAGTIT